MYTSHSQTNRTQSNASKQTRLAERQKTTNVDEKKKKKSASIERAYSEWIRNGVNKGTFCI